MGRRGGRLGRRRGRLGGGVEHQPSDPQRADPERLRGLVEALEGERHPDASPAALREAFRWIGGRFESVGLRPRRHRFTHRGRAHENLAAALPARDPEAPRILVGAHVDTVRGTPGADDNASGVAGLLEAARLLTAGPARSFRAPIELVAFDLEELRGLTYRVGSRRWTARARREGVRYAGALILEMIGYRTERPESQAVPLPLRWRDIPRRGDFLACIGDSKSGALVHAFREAAADAAPGLDVVTLRSPLRGWALPATRRSDNASFWSDGYPALLLTDTANLRNPHYHRASDRSDTLDYRFMADVVDGVVAAVRRLAA